MRGRKPRKGQAVAFNTICEDMNKMRTRFKPEHVPDIAAWLLVLGARHAKILAHLKERKDKNPESSYRAAVRDQELRVEIVGGMLAVVGQPWNRLDWLEAQETLTKLAEQALAEQAGRAKLHVPDLGGEG